MTALKPIENRSVRGVLSGRYPLNKRCAHPECTEDAAEGHHIFPRSTIGNTNWFVEIQWYDAGDGESGSSVSTETIPHVTGLCREHHDQVERHDAWIKLEEGEFVWYNRTPPDEGPYRDKPHFTALGPLNPQPAREGKPKRKRFKGEARRKRRTISIKVPDDAAENGGEVWDETMGLVTEKLHRLDVRALGDEAEVDERTAYFIIIDALNDWLSFPDEVSLSG